MNVSAVTTSPVATVNTVPFDRVSTSSASPHSIDTIEEDLAQRQSSSGLFSPPILLLHLMEETYEIGQSTLHSLSNQASNFVKNSATSYQEMQTALQQIAQKYQNVSVWSSLQQMSMCLTASWNFFLGSSLVTTGSPILGGTLIATSILSVAHIAMTQVEGWNHIAKQLAQGNEELEKSIRLWLPIAIQCLTSTAATLGSAYHNDMLSFDWDRALYLYDHMISAGKSFITAQISWSEESIGKIRDAIFTNTLLQEELLQWISSFNDLLNQGWETAKQMILTASQLRI